MVGHSSDFVCETDNQTSAFLWLLMKGGASIVLIVILQIVGLRGLVQHLWDGGW